METEYIRSFLHKLYSLSSRVQQFRNMEITLHTDAKLNSFALSTLEVINENPGKNMSEISTMMGITKGALSQMAKKLEKKGLIKKNRTEHNDKNFFIMLTPKGAQALDEYLLLHDKLYQSLSEVLSHYQKDELEFIWHFLCETSELIGNIREYLTLEYSESSKDT